MNESIVICFITTIFVAVDIPRLTMQESQKYRVKFACLVFLNSPGFWFEHSGEGYGRWMNTNLDCLTED